MSLLSTFFNRDRNRRRRDGDRDCCLVVLLEYLRDRDGSILFRSLSYDHLGSSTLDRLVHLIYRGYLFGLYLLIMTSIIIRYNRNIEIASGGKKATVDIGTVVPLNRNILHLQSLPVDILDF